MGCHKKYFDLGAQTAKNEYLTLGICTYFSQNIGAHSKNFGAMDYWAPVSLYPWCDKGNATIQNTTNYSMLPRTDMLVFAYFYHIYKKSG